MDKYTIHPYREFSDVRQLIEWAGDTHGDKIAYSYRIKAGDKDIQKVSFSRLRSDVRHLASRLRNLGCSGKHCAVVGGLSYDWVRVYYGVLCAGGILVPLDKDWT